MYIFKDIYEGTDHVIDDSPCCTVVHNVSASVRSQRYNIANIGVVGPSACPIH